ncbi:Do family serine endopeptidase [Vulgatibacter incomptus]|nr:Do family serine endopeptidase [Vulgatibacter incomptus]
MRIELAAMLAIAALGLPGISGGAATSGNAVGLAKKDPAPPHTGAEGETPSLAPLVDRVRPTVVGVTTISKGKGPSPEIEEFWRRFFGRNAPKERGKQIGLGSGVIIDPSGIILTNNHVVAGAQKVLVRTSDDQEHQATVVGTDPDTDVAVIKITEVKGPLQAATLGDSDAIRVGDYVVAIGNPFGLELTVTSGIISAKARVIGATPFDDFLQTDAAINPGNSGGPLFDLSGRVIGINTAIVATGQGIGFAVPIDLIKALLPQLEKTGRVVRGFLGVGVQDLTPELARALGVKAEKGALVSSVDKNGPAANVLHPGDVITTAEGKPVTNAAELSRQVSQLKPGAVVTLGVLREGKQQTVKVKLGERPSKEGKEKEQPPELKPEQGPVGLSISPVPKELADQMGIDGGALVVDVEPGSRAAEAGLRQGDVIVEANRKPVKAPKDLIDVAKKNPKQPLALRVRRGEAAIYLVIPTE